ncbi:MAG TPA: hypothetical protein VK947_06765, partial [Planococcus sp. (in: firmicutes)]|nr:hypothetical protein [Planococcus sp. (in: firmicutes)]
DAAFASLVRISGVGAKSAISKITLLGGLASSVFWPIGFFLAENYGWRLALIVYAAIALSTLPLHLAIPKTRFKEQPVHEEAMHPSISPVRLDGHELKMAGALYAMIFMLLNFLSSAMSTHMISILAGLGLGAALSVWASTLRGIGQSVARVCEVLFGKRLHPMTLSVLAASLLPFGFAAGFFSGQFVVAAFAFTFLFGAGNGLMTISRGTLPLVLFDSRSYGSYVGKLLMPSFLLSAVAPLVYTYIIANFGEWTALALSAAIAFVILAASLVLKIKYGSSTT